MVFEPVISVEPIWKMNTALGLPWALSVTLPDDSSNELEAVRTPGENVCPARSVPAEPLLGTRGGVVVGGRQGVLGFDRNRVVDVRLPEHSGAPVTDEPGLSPRSPNIVVGPVLVTVEPANTEKGAADPKPTVAVAPRALLANRRLDSDPSSTRPARQDFGTPLFMGVSSLRR